MCQGEDASLALRKPKLATKNLAFDLGDYNVIMLLEKDFFSKGAHAKVYRLGPHDPWKSRADLVREEESSGRTDHLVLFYSQKIAQALYPGHFIHTSGSRTEVVEGSSETPWKQSLFTREARVKKGHRVFAAHMEIVPFMGKGSFCSCTDCRQHREFHQDEGLLTRAFEVQQEVARAGVVVDPTDQSDYCLESNGQLIFFEAAIWSAGMRDFFGQKTCLTQEERRAKRLFARLEGLADHPLSCYRK
jgi:hypothetical protein